MERDYIGFKKEKTMGAWDTDPFGNDTACDWAYELEDTDDLSLIEHTIQKIHDTGPEYLEAPDSEEAIAAADVIARLKGKVYVTNAYTEAVDAWVASHKLKPTKEMVDAAIKAIDRILAPPSELLELWEESDDFDGWRQHMEDLKRRLE